MHEEQVLTRGWLRLRMVTNLVRWWIECDDLENLNTYRYDHRAGSRHGLMPSWNAVVAMVAREELNPRTSPMWACVGVMRENDE